MRKTITLGLFALIFSLFSSQVLAGKVALCEEQKDELQAAGLYGLCNAYYNAKNQNARDRILIAYNDKVLKSGGPPMPGTEIKPEPKDDGTFDCLCWNDVDFEAVCAMGMPGQVEFNSDSGVVVAVTWTDIGALTVELFGSDSPNCGHVIQNLLPPGEPLFEVIRTDLTLDEALDCQAELDVIAMIHLNKDCPEF